MGETAFLGYYLQMNIYFNIPRGGGGAFVTLRNKIKIQRTLTILIHLSFFQKQRLLDSLILFFYISTFMISDITVQSQVGPPEVHQKSLPAKRKTKEKERNPAKTGTRIKRKMTDLETKKRRIEKKSGRRRKNENVQSSSSIKRNKKEHARSRKKSARNANARKELKKNA